jgi:hypothetical protein
MLIYELNYLTFYDILTTDNGPRNSWYEDEIAIASILGPSFLIFSFDHLPLNDIMQYSHTYHGFMTRI